MNIMIVTNAAYLPSAKVLLTSLFEQHIDDKIDVYLVHAGLTDVQVSVLDKLCASYNQKKLHNIQIQKEQIAKLKPTYKLGIETYFRIVALNLLPSNIDKILYLDVDMVIKKPLTDLYNTDLEGNVLAACLDIYGYVYLATQESEKRLGLKLKESYFNAGVMLLDMETVRKENIGDKVLDYIYNNEDKLEWMDQDALNAVLEGRCKLLPWHLFNCTPCLFVCDKNEVEKGIIRPLYRNETSKIDDYPGQYLDMTQAIFDAAHVIHYLGETKPWIETRPKASCYDIFDRALYENSKKGRLIIMTGVYDTLDIFAYEFAKDFRIMGYEVMIFDSSNMQKSLGAMASFIEKPVSAVITFNNLGFNMELTEGQNTWDVLGIYCINILMDHPVFHKAALDNAPKLSVVLCPDKNHMNYVQRFYPDIPITGFLGHGGKEISANRPKIKDRSIDILYAGGISTPFIEQSKPDFSCYDFDLKQIADKTYDVLINNPDRTSESVIEELLTQEGISLSDKELNEVIAALKYVEMMAVTYFREQTVKVLVEAGIDVTIYGTGWDTCDWIKNPHAHFMGRIPAEEVVQKMLDSKIVLNTMTWFKDGTHDRVFNGMLAGAVAVTDSSIYMKEEFDDDSLVMFELSEISALPKKIRDLLSDESRMQQIADTGYEKAINGHTLRHRAEEIDEALLS